MGGKDQQIKVEDFRAYPTDVLNFCKITHTYTYETLCGENDSQPLVLDTIQKTITPMISQSQNPSSILVNVIQSVQDEEGINYASESQTFYISILDHD